MAKYNEDLERISEDLDQSVRNKSITHRVNNVEFRLYHDVKYLFHKKHDVHFGDILRDKMILFLEQMKRDLDN